MKYFNHLINIQILCLIAKDSRLRFLKSQFICFQTLENRLYVIILLVEALNFVPIRRQQYVTARWDSKIRNSGSQKWFGRCTHGDRPFESKICTFVHHFKNRHTNQ